MDACKYLYPVDNFQTMMFEWYIGVSLWWTQFKANFVYYMEYYIPIKDVTIVKKVIEIGTAVQKLINSKVNDV